MAALNSIVRDLVAGHPAETADILSRMSPEAGAAVLSSVAAAAASATLARMAPHHATECLAAMEAEAAARILDSLSAPLAAKLLRSSGAALAESILAGVADRSSIESLLEYPPMTVGRIMDPQAPSVPSDWSIDRVRSALGKIARPYCPYIYVVDSSGALVGVLHIPELESLPDSLVEPVMRRGPLRIQALSSLSSIVDDPAWNDYDVLPVTGHLDLLVGILRHKDLRRHGVFSVPVEEGIEESLGEVALALGEVYWSGLWKIVDGFAPARIGSRSDAGDQP